MGAEKFFAEYWLKKPVQLKTQSNFDNLLTASDIDQLMYFADANMRVLKYKNEEVINREIPKVKNAPNMYSIYDAWHEGNSLSIDDLQRYWPPLTELSQHLETVFHTQVGANIYFTPPGGKCFPPHYDGHDVIVLQVEGDKIWNIWEGDTFSPPTTGNPIDDPSSLPNPILELTLNEGDVLYVPRGFPHQAWTVEGRSLHITLQLATPTLKDLRDTMLKAANHLKITLPSNLSGDFNNVSARPELNQSLPVGYLDKDNLDDGLSEWFDPVITQILINEAKKAFHHGMTHNHQPAKTGYFDYEQHLNNIQPNTMLKKRNASSCTFGTDSSQSWFKFHMHTIFSDLSMITSFQYIAETESFYMADIPGDASYETKHQAIIELVKKGLLSIAV